MEPADTSKVDEVYSSRTPSGGLGQVVAAYAGARNPAAASWSVTDLKS
jgi:hypothetical protein